MTGTAMATCPSGHESADTDYCDVCGALIEGPSATTAGHATGPSAPGAAPTGAGSGTGVGTGGVSGSGPGVAAGAYSGSGPGTHLGVGAGTSPASGVNPGPGSGGSGTPAGPGSGGLTGPASGSGPTGATPSCPECAAPRTGRFCEECGFDFTAPAAPTRARPVPPTVELPATPAGPQPASSAGHPAAAPAGPLAGTWSVTITADPDYHRAVADRADDESEAVPFPAYCPERRFTLAGGQLLIGRRSRSRGIVPDIDLTGPPEDTGVSHVHALLVATADGWELVDPGSTNGTRLNGAEDALPENSPVRLADGDRIHVGAWTTITIQKN
ncbi:FHA domain-containing protein [Longispora sp. K20-0274]|uniref:FHA domain-containing protein n=1 Tax=Longispora sp. K20-0274 TaxID=3088255 RepID=UPI00399C31F0